jgi:outer membrane protein TolC
LVWIQEQFSIQQLELEKQNFLLLLKNLNGGNEVMLSQDRFSENFALDRVNSLWTEKQTNDPELQLLVQREEVALQQLSLSKKNFLPNITAGFNHQGVSGEYYSGIYGGVSIPLWSNKNKVKSSEAHYEYQQTYTEVQRQNLHAAFEKKYNEYQFLYQSFEEYYKTLQGLNSEALLLQAYELGEISFMEYYMELKFYREALDTQIQIELQLSQLRAQLLKHQL